MPIIDTHIHLFDTRRPQGVPWPPKDDKILYKPALPDRYASIAEPLGPASLKDRYCDPAKGTNALPRPNTEGILRPRRRKWHCWHCGFECCWESGLAARTSNVLEEQF
jgi:hypothetical protein